ncbi:AfsA-related hotdog domain-containing protein [Amycolatopsis rhabdoformis]|uniref:AfsA-related hotdog domain-containing protein n=1 Tax=Amycolatopsis rhabdoformis TaxID=1448059 RepID=A0ABZ1I6R8_9PSEU|nr:AfsA-related hotdog domain-containing protein [Amycolatopsis rhabdoformis]WSE29661.1 AfsA-related hotdog domain-containing protein [Amycolatopsis rhabdoformis]
MDTTLSPAPPELGYDQTVPRGLVHRWSLSEVFLTGYAGIDGTVFACAAQLPLSHSYFRDHPEQREWYDPLNVLEAARQAVTYAAHVNQGVPRDTTFMVTAWSLEIIDAAALACAERPGELRIDGTVTDRRERGGSVRLLAFAMDLSLGGQRLGRLTMDVGCTPTDQYHLLRRMQRGTEVPTAFGLPAEAAGTPVPPHEVGRLDPVNAVLDDVVRAGDELTAVLSPRTFANRSMYDHPYDHVPAMVLSEAARQCALLLSADGTWPRRVLRLDGQFRKFAELDAPVTLAAAPAGPARAYRLIAQQGDATVAEIDLVLG